MVGDQCPKCKQAVPPGPLFCLKCGAFLEESRNEAGRAKDPWQSTHFPPEVGIVIGLIVVEMITASLPSRTVTTGQHGAEFLQWLTGGLVWVLFLAVDLLTIVGLSMRLGWAWWLTVSLWSLRASVAFVILFGASIGLKSGTGPDVASWLGFLTFVLCTTAPVILLIIVRVRGAYLPRMAGERENEREAESRSKMACRRCGDPCPEVDNNWTRAGLCSKKCMENEA
jgi:hypothetical protein